MQAYDFHCTGVFTNTTPTDAYRGAGRPEATYAIERTIDALARRVGKDPVEIRRLNFLRGPFPRPIVSGLEVDAGDFDAALDRGLELLDLRGVPERAGGPAGAGHRRSSSASASRRTSRCAGSRPPGSSARSSTAAAAGRRWSFALLPTGTVQVVSGTSPHGQGHATTFSQIVADRLGVRLRRDRVPPRRHRGLSAGLGHLREPEPRRRRRRPLARLREDRRQGTADRRAPARGLGGRPGVRGRPVHRAGAPTRACR